MRHLNADKDYQNLCLMSLFRQYLHLIKVVFQNQRT
jgi:hypothetical protein